MDPDMDPIAQQSVFRFFHDHSLPITKPLRPYNYSLIQLELILGCISAYLHYKAGQGLINRRPKHKGDCLRSHKCKNCKLAAAQE